MPAYPAPRCGLPQCVRRAGRALSAPGRRLYSPAQAPLPPVPARTRTSVLPAPAAGAGRRLPCRQDLQAQRCPPADKRLKCARPKARPPVFWADGHAALFPAQRWPCPCTPPDAEATQGRRKRHPAQSRPVPRSRSCLRLLCVLHGLYQIQHPLCCPVLGVQHKAAGVGGAPFVIIFVGQGITLHGGHLGAAVG